MKFISFFYLLIPIILYCQKILFRVIFVIDLLYLYFRYYASFSHFLNYFIFKFLYNRLILRNFSNVLIMVHHIFQFNSHFLLFLLAFFHILIQHLIGLSHLLYVPLVIFGCGEELSIFNKKKTVLNPIFLLILWLQFIKTILKCRL